ncbi:hypothetical protein BM607_003160 [Shewanella sp. SACH]|uniref:SEC-C metal-binding domain-containing protein n=1 Tax=Shewanella sp. SM87 TaxID=2912808 RepID=UPI000903191A|nr:hypothetical protein BM607_003160 [Shewanella sp. SACH]
MDTRGNLYELTHADLIERQRMLGSPLIPLNEQQFKELQPMTKNQRKNSMRNRECPCGSGHKFKKCCWGKYA